MIEFLQTLAIAAIPSTLTAILSYLAASKNSDMQIKTIKEQNKADIEKLIEQNKIDIVSLKEKHRMEMELKEQEYKHQIELMNIQNQNEMKKEEEMMKNQLAVNALGGIVSGIFSPQSPVSGMINNALAKGFENAMNSANKEN